jgi:NAD(P)-dependent dehydrogenase (short-subunit alcohol dehydrogenase family)
MRVLVIGGTGTIGSAIVRSLSAQHDVLVACRSVRDTPVDITDPDLIRQLFERIGTVDAVVCAAGEAVFKPLDELSDDDHGVASKLMGQVNVVRHGHPFVQDGGSLTLTSGKLGRRPMPGTTSISLINAALEGFVRAAALELPRGLRINAVSPEWTTGTLELFGMDPSWGISAESVAAAYVVAVEGSMTGTVIDAGWLYDPAADYLTVATGSLAVA